MPLTTLETIPPELVLLIFRHLSPVDACCLALCSRYFLSLCSPFDRFDTLGRTWSGIRTGEKCRENLRIDLLTRLARYLPQYYLCHGCLRLHLWQHIDLPSPKFELRKCFDSIPSPGRYDNILLMPANICHFPTYSYHKLHFVHVHLVMRRFYFGQSVGIPASSLLYTEVGNMPMDQQTRHLSNKARAQMSEKEYWACHRKGLMSVEARICCADPPGLCLRVQSLAVVRRQNVQHFYCVEKETVEICKHIGTTKGNFDGVIESLVDRYLQEEKENGEDQLLRRGRCGQCNTAWKMEIREIDDRKEVCLLLTQWKDLGPGLIPEDDLWRSQADRVLPRTLKASDMVEDPRRRFEEQFDGSGSTSSQFLSEEQMLLRNLSLLRGQRYRTIMRRWGDWWYLQGEEAQAKKSQCIVN